MPGKNLLECGLRAVHQTHSVNGKPSASKSETESSILSWVATATGVYRRTRALGAWGQGAVPW